jgi:predicted kinase
MEDTRKPRLVLFCGLPGSGKTTLAKTHEAQGKGIRICTDEWQADLEVKSGAVYDDFHDRLQKRLYRLTLELLKNHQDVILEDGLRLKQERTEKLADAKKYGATVELHFFDLSFDEILKRLESRNNDMPHGAVNMTKDDLQKCWDLFQKPTPEELGDLDKVFVYNDSIITGEPK